MHMPIKHVPAQLKLYYRIRRAAALTRDQISLLLDQIQTDEFLFTLTALYTHQVWVGGKNQSRQFDLVPNVTDTNIPHQCTQLNSLTCFTCTSTTSLNL